MKQARLYIEWDFYINDSEENVDYHYDYVWNEDGVNPDHMSDLEKYYYLIKYFGLIEFVNIPEEHAYNLDDPEHIEFIVDNYLKNQFSMGFIVKSLKRIDESKEFYRVYMTIKRMNVFDDGPYEFETFYYPNLNVIEINEIIKNINDEYEKRHELDILKNNLWVWEKDDPLTSILGKHLEVINNSNNKLLSPREWFLKYGAII
tara:strand:- start:323 stop:931 length:609 start_codon:yes stop_codon:yes gene_type:complete